MSGCIPVYEPVAPCIAEERSSRQGLEALRGKVIGFIDNSKPNFNHLVENLSALLVEEHGVARVVTRRKRSASEGATETVVRELLDQCDAVITGSGD
jgi:hypothetical protein